MVTVPGEIALGEGNLIVEGLAKMADIVVAGDVVTDQISANEDHYEEGSYERIKSTLAIESYTSTKNRPYPQVVKGRGID